MANPANSVIQNLLPVQAYFTVDGTFQTFIGQGQPFYASVDPSQTGLNITNSTINSTTIGATTPSTAAFTSATVSSAPVNGNDVVNKTYLDYFATGLSWKQPVLCGTTANITLSGVQTLDGISAVAGSRVLVKNQTAPAENGIYISAAGAWARSTDADSWDELISAICFVESGTTLAGSAWYCTVQPGGTIGATAITWSNFSVASVYTAGTGLTLSSYQFSITPVGTAGTYGSASQVPVFITNASGQVTSATNTSIAIAGNQITSGTIDTARISGSYTGITGVGTLTAGTWNASTIGVAYGGTGAATLTGYVKGTGTAALTASATIPSTDISGLGTMSTQNANNVAITGGTIATLTSPIAVGSGGTGASTLTGYVKGAGTTALTASSTIPSGDISGLGTMATQNASSVAITGGTESGVTHSGDTIGTYLDYTSVSAPSYAEGRVWYDSTVKALTYNNDISGNSLHIGQETQLKVRNSTGSTIAKGAPVYITSTSSGVGFPNIALARADTLTTGNAIGLTNEAIANGADGYVVINGILNGVNTGTFTVGDILYVSPYSAGQLMNTFPPTGYPVRIGVVSFVNSSTGSIYINQSNAFVQASSVVGTLAIANGGTNGTATPTAGGVPYGTGTAYAFTAAGTAGYVLTSNGASAPTWAVATAYATVTDDTTTNATRYPLFANQTTGNLTTEYVSSTKLKYNPSTGALTASQLIIAP